MAEEALNLPMNTFVNLPLLCGISGTNANGFMAGRPAVRQNTENLKFTAYWIVSIFIALKEVQYCYSVINAFQSVLMYCSHVCTKIEFHFIAQDYSYTQEISMHSVSTA